MYNVTLILVDFEQIEIYLFFYRFLEIYDKIRKCTLGLSATRISRL